MYDKSEIFRTAWAEAKDTLTRYSYAPHQLRELFVSALRKAWFKAKQIAALAARSIESLTAEIENLRNKTRLDWNGQQYQRQLQDALALAVAREAEIEFAAKRDLIASAGGRFCTVTFTKIDGTERTMRIQPAKLKFHVKGSAASDSARKAVRTRTRRHPNLFPVWDTDKAAPRSVNLATVSRIVVDGTAHNYAA
ncbi:MAG: hypothetical protein ACU0CA_14295 [Paracoccaceae bacterium]